MIINNYIITKRLLMRCLNLADVGTQYLDWMSDPEITKYLELRFSPPKDLSELAEFVAKTNASSNELLLGIFTRDSRQHIGNIKLGPICGNHNRADLGFIIGNRDFWGKGLATEAILAVSRYAFAELKLAKVTAGCYESNRGSACALKKAGFSQEGRLIGHWSVAGTREDGLLFGLSSSSGAD